MTLEHKEQHPKLPLGKDLHKVRISVEEMGIAYRHREMTGEPIQTFIRRLIREYQEPYGDGGEKP